jgi:hypothetical protein
MTRLIETIGTFLISLALPIQVLGDDKGPDPEALAKAGQASIKRFENESASWTVINHAPNGSLYVVEVAAAPKLRRWVLSVEIKGRREEFARITQKDGVWYLKEGRKARKYRRFEAPLDAPTGYIYLMRSEPQFIARAIPLGFGTYEGTRNGVATYRSPLPEAQKKQLENAIADFDKFTKQNGARAVNPETTRSIESARDLLARGVSTDVELESGLVLQFGAPERRTKVSRFRFGNVDPAEFATDGTTWDDQTDDPTAGDRQDLLMIGHCGVWRPGMPSPEADGRLLNIKTGRLRRVPFHGGISLPGCFTTDRSHVVVTGFDTAGGVMGLYDIDLKTGANRQLGGDLLATGFSLFPSLSPDGKTVAILHKGASEAHILEFQICLVDLASGQAKPLGQPRDTGPLAWLPDGNALLVTDRKAIDVKKPPVSTICRMDLDGRITPLCEGTAPVVLGDGKRILFEDQTSRTWKTCDLDGKDIKLYAGGMEGCAFPSISPDGKRLVMMRFRTGEAPEPVIFTLGESEGKPATTAPGLWKSPSWR